MYDYLKKVVGHFFRSVEDIRLPFILFIILFIYVIMFQFSLPFPLTLVPRILFILLYFPSILLSQIEKFYKNESFETFAKL